MPERLSKLLIGRHTQVTAIARFFAYDHLSGPMRAVSEHCAILAANMIESLGDEPELTVGLRKLLEAKDCFVRQALVDSERQNA